MSKKLEELKNLAYQIDDEDFQDLVDESKAMTETLPVSEQLTEVLMFLPEVVDFDWCVIAKDGTAQFIAINPAMMPVMLEQLENVVSQLKIQIAFTAPTSKERGN